MTDKDSLGNRMKGYEDAYRAYLEPKTPMIIRVDGRAFHTYTKKFRSDWPWSVTIRDAMTQAASRLLSEISGAKIVYLQSDEMSILVTEKDKVKTLPWFGKNLQKIASVSASIATVGFNMRILDLSRQDNAVATFDARAFTLPEDEVCNYFIWRQQDAIKNSMEMLAQRHFSHKQLLKKKGADKIAMLQEKGIEWSNCRIWEQRGWSVTRETYQKEVEGGTPVTRHQIVENIQIPLFTEDRNFINCYLKDREP